MRTAISLTDFIQTTSTIECSSCKAIAGTENEYEPEREFYDLGWRATKNNCYCPKCAKKKLSQKKSNTK